METNIINKVRIIIRNMENSESIDCGQANAPLADKIDDPSMWLVHEALDDFRRLGV